MAAILLNGVSFTPSDVQENREKIGTAIKAANGARRWAQRANKRQWSISWEDVPAAQRDAVRTVFNLTTTFTFQDPDGNTATVFCQEGAYKSNVSDIVTEGGVQVLYYTVSLDITEA